MMPRDLATVHYEIEQIHLPPFAGPSMAVVEAKTAVENRLHFLPSSIESA